MPNRILREGILTSSKMGKLGWAEEVFYRRLMSVVDDFGRYFADAGMLRAACYPRQLNKVSDSDVGKWLHACEAADLVRVYPAQDGERYLELLNFGQQVRAKKSRFPDMLSTCEADAEHVQANAHLDVSVSVSVSEDEIPARKRAATPDGVDVVVWTDFLKVRKAKRAPMTDLALEGIRREAGLAGLSLNDALRTCVERGWQSFKAEWVAKKPSLADIARVTVPGRTERDPALVKAERDAANAAPMPEFARKLAAQLTGKALQ